jgi:hypothetical protein
MSSIENILMKFLERFAQLEHRVDNLIQPAIVKERDLEKGVRYQIGGTDSEPYLSPWTKPSDKSGTTAFLPQIGAKALLISPAGDLNQAASIPHGHSDDHKNPATDKDEFVLLNQGNVRISALNGVFTIKAGDTTFVFNGAGFTQTGGAMKHDGKNIGKNHHHEGVKAGSNLTGDPVA